MRSGMKSCPTPWRPSRAGQSSGRDQQPRSNKYDYFAPAQVTIFIPPSLAFINRIGPIVLIQVAVSEQQSEFVYLDTIEGEPGINKEYEEIGHIIDIIDNRSRPVSRAARARRESGVTSASSVSGTRPGSGLGTPLMGQVWRALHRQMTGTSARRQIRQRRQRSSPRGGLGTPRSGSGQGLTLLSNSSSPRSHKSESSNKSGTEINEIETSLARTDEKVKTLSSMDNGN